MRHARGAGVMIGMVVLVLVVWASPAQAYCPHQNVLETMITSVCWECLFPISLSGATLADFGEDPVEPAQGQLPMFCYCCDSSICLPGLPLGFWNPTHLVEVVRQPWCLPSLGGVTVGPNSIEGHGSVSTQSGDQSENFTFYQTHFVAFPVFKLVDLLVDVLCQNWLAVGDQVDVVYLSELDPSWDDDVIATFMAPEVLLINNPIAQAACGTDAVAATAGQPINALWWCAGGWGSLYPMSGNIAGGGGGQVKPAALAVARMLAKLARIGTEFYTAGNKDQICRDFPTFLLVKDQYKMQLVAPVANTSPACCYPIGRSLFRWGLGKSYPVEGDDFTFLLWKLQRCCLKVPGT